MELNQVDVEGGNELIFSACLEYDHLCSMHVYFKYTLGKMQAMSAPLLRKFGLNLYPEAWMCLPLLGVFSFGQ